MNDSAIVELYWARSEQAVVQTAAKYGAYCHRIAFGILHSEADAEESVNDTYYAAWNAMPPHKPAVLSTFLGKLTRRISIDHWRRTGAQKRGRGEMPLVLEELRECTDCCAQPQQLLEKQELAEAVNRFLRRQSSVEQSVFVCRYWYLDSVAEIAIRFRFSQSKVKSMLYRMRRRLTDQLKKEGLL